MPEYLTPAVYVEETSFRSRSIEGVPTATFGMTGRTQYGPVPYTYPVPGGEAVVSTNPPVLVTSMTEYERAFGGLVVDGTPCSLALAARAFFANGGRRLYVARAFSFTERTEGTGANATQVMDVVRNFASLPVGGGQDGANPPPLARWVARWPGSYGSRIKVTVAINRSKNVLIDGRVVGVGVGGAVELRADDPTDPKALPGSGTVSVVRADPKDTKARVLDPAPQGGVKGFHITLSVTVSVGQERSDTYSELELGWEHPHSIFTVLEHRDPPDEYALVWLQPAVVAANQPRPTVDQLLPALVTDANGRYLSEGGPGEALTATDLEGRKADPDDASKAATGLFALGEVDDIAIVAMPDMTDLDESQHHAATDALIDHCQTERYRIGIVDPPRDSSLSEVREFRSRFDSSYTALYYPWVRLVDPTRRPDPGGPTPMMDLPPSGYVAGIYARSDVERGVHKAPANEVVLGVDRFVTNVTFDRQSVLNPEGINALRFFEGRSHRVWGARTMSSDPEWKYVNVRRLFIYLEHSIFRSTQWAVFEPNNERLWASIRQTVSDFLFATWRTGALMGTKPEEAFFVRCDRTTMTQNDLDNGRLICLIGVAPTYPAEFVIFRIGQWTADAQNT